MDPDEKFKDGDALFQTLDATNKQEIIFLTNKQQAYKAHLYDFDDSKASVLGDYLPSKLRDGRQRNSRYLCSYRAIIPAA